LAEPAVVGPGGFGVSRSPTRQALQRLGRNRLAIGSGIFLLVVAAIGPSSEHWFGTDNLGRDIWSRVVHGARVSLVVGLASQAIAFAIGLTVGAVAGFAGGVLDSALMRATDIMQALPSVLLALLFLTALGASTTVLVLSIGLATWAVIARVVRAQVLVQKELLYVEAAYSIGCSTSRTLIRHVLPNVLGPAIVLVTFGIPQATFT
jgi:ABC-type dipeptide/oligopeptide/nickel transport system permease subunit